MKVLVAEDEVTSRKLLERTLSKWGYDVSVVTNGREALTVLSSDDAPRIGILDWQMPEMDGVEVCQHLRKQESGQFTYLIMLTAKARTEDIVLALDCGADTYLTKPFSVSELRARLGAGERILELQSQLVVANTHLNLLARVDALTQVYNRRAVVERLVEELDRRQRQHTPIAVSMLDIDYFKRINDNYGHTTGDRTLVALANTLEQARRPYDLVGRYGGEEFLLAFPGASFEDAHAIAFRILETIRSTSVVSDSGESIRVTASLGVCWAPIDVRCSADEIIGLSDQLLYRAKKQGRDQCVVADLEVVRLEEPMGG